MRRRQHPLTGGMTARSALDPGEKIAGVGLLANRRLAFAGGANAASGTSR
jgi:hypothetical protein